MEIKIAIILDCSFNLLKIWYDYKISNIIYSLNVNNISLFWWGNVLLQLQQILKYVERKYFGNNNYQTCDNFHYEYKVVSSELLTKYINSMYKSNLIDDQII